MISLTLTQESEVFAEENQATQSEDINRENDEYLRSNEDKGDNFANQEEVINADSEIEIKGFSETEETEAPFINSNENEESIEDKTDLNEAVEEDYEDEAEVADYFSSESWEDQEKEEEEDKDNIAGNDSFSSSKIPSFVYRTKTMVFQTFSSFLSNVKRSFHLLLQFISSFLQKISLNHNK